MFSHNIFKFIAKSNPKSFIGLNNSIRLFENAIPTVSATGTNEAMPLTLRTRTSGSFFRVIDKKAIQIFLNGPGVLEGENLRLARGGSFNLLLADNADKQIDKKTQVHFRLNSIDMNYISHMIHEKVENELALNEMFSPMDSVTKEKGEKVQRSLICKVTPDKKKRCEITVQYTDKKHTVVLDDREAVYLASFIDFELPQICGWDILSRYSLPRRVRENEDGSPRAPRSNRFNNDRPDRFDRQDRFDRPDRFDRQDRPERSTEDRSNFRSSPRNNNPRTPRKFTDAPHGSSSTGSFDSLGPNENLADFFKDEPRL